MGKFDGCILACDVDGTLMSNEYINPKNIEKIDFFVKEGGKLSISTGRSIPALTSVLEKVNNIGPSVVANGAVVYDYSVNKILFQEEFSKNDYYIAEIVKECDLNVGIEVHCGTEVFTLKRNEIATIHQDYEKFVAPDVSFEDVVYKKWNKVLFACESLQDREILKEMLSQYEIEGEFISTAAFLGGAWNYYLEQVPKGASKAKALEKICEIFKIKKGKLFAIGDYYNDVPMLKSSDICAVPCDAPDDVKALAEYITCSCKDGAVADFIDYLTNEAKF